MKPRITRAFIAVLLCICAFNPATAQRPTAQISRIAVSPAAPVLDGRESRQQLVVTGFQYGGAVIDLTDVSIVESLNNSIARVDSWVLHPVSDGTAQVRVRAGGRSVTIPVTVRGSRKPFRWTFENHVESVFSRQGCNTGPCHGAGSGKGGLKLSLRAYDPDSDYLRLRTEGRGRRIIRARPTESLLLRKPSLNIAHVGGLKLRRDSLEYRVVREWIADGAPGPTAKTPKLTRLDVYPADRTLSAGSVQQLQVTARFSDGHTEDVTHWARFSSNEEPIARVDESGRVTMRGCGETAITAWYLGKVAFARVRVPFGPTSAGSAVRASGAETSPRSQIDSFIEVKLSQLGLEPSGPCTDGQFIRRAFLDCIATLPTPEETRLFAADPRPDKRARLITSLLERPEYVDYWAYRWSDLLRVNRDLIGERAASALHSWLRVRVAQNDGWDHIAFEILTASGPADANGPASFYRMGTKPEEFAETVSQAFLGVRVQCAHCHNHPFEKWTQADYYRMANAFARVGRKKVAGIEVVFSSYSGDVSHPRLGRPLPPAPLDGPALPLDSRLDRREFLARWMVSSANPYFGRAIVNRVWKQFMGRGLVEPVDDMRLTNPASNEPLLAELTREFTATGFDIKRLIRRIMSTRAYQRSAAPTARNARDDRFYSRYIARRIGAETLLDALCQVTGTVEKFAAIPAGGRAISLPDTRVGSAFLDSFGRPARVVTCECERNMEPNMAQALHLINAATLNEKILGKGSTLNRLLDSGASDVEITDDLTLRCLSRNPTPSERSAVRKALEVPTSATREDRSTNRKQVFADLLWALVSGPEFVFNH